MKMIVIHDIPEIIDGDIPAFIKELDEKKNYENEDHYAQEIFGKLWPLWDEYLQLYREFEQWTSLEWRLAKCLDQIESQLQHLDSGIEYRSSEEVWEHMLTYPDKALAALWNSSVDQIWQLIKSELETLTQEWYQQNS